MARTVHRSLVSGRCLALLAPLLLCAAAATQAATNSAARVAAFAQLPDWSGVWHVEGSAATLDGARGQVAAPYRPDWQAKYAQARQNTAHVRDTLDRFCYAGVPRVMSADADFMLFVTPEETQLQGARHDIRHLWTDGRPHPPADELWPLTWGESIGRWEGQTLVVQTVSLKGGQWLDPTGATLSDAARVTERIRLLGKDRLENRITIVDDTALTRPWTYTRTYRRTGAGDLQEVDCKWSAGAGAKADK